MRERARTMPWARPAPDESGFAVRPWFRFSAGEVVLSNQKARFSGRNRIARRWSRRAGVRERVAMRPGQSVAGPPALCLLDRHI